MGFGITTSRSTHQTTQQTNEENQIGAGDNSQVANRGGTIDNGSHYSADRGGTVNISSVDPGSYAFASEVVRQSYGATASAVGGISDLAAKTQDTLSKLAQGTPLGQDWKRLAVPLAIVGAILAAFLFRRK